LSTLSSAVCYNEATATEVCHDCEIGIEVLAGKVLNMILTADLQKKHRMKIKIKTMIQHITELVIFST